MPGPNLPTNLDTTYADDGSDASVKLHQQHHDTGHGLLNKFDKDAVPAANQFLVWNGATSLYVPRALASTDAVLPSEKGAALGVATLDVDSVVVQEPKTHTHQSYQTVRYAGSPFTARTSLNFLGAGVSVADDSGNGYTAVTINAPDVRTIVAASPTTVNNNNSTLVDVTGMTTAVLANEHWEGTAILFYDSSGTADIKYSLVVPTGATVRGIAQGLGGGVSSEVGSHRLHAIDASGMTGLLFGGLGVGNRAVAMFNFRVLVAGTAGNIKFQMMQGTVAEVSDTISQAESWMTVARIA